jgi:hypothetical protein
MVGSDGSEYLIEKRFVELLPNDRIVLKQISEHQAFRMAMEVSRHSWWNPSGLENVF